MKIIIKVILTALCLICTIHTKENLYQRLTWKEKRALIQTYRDLKNAYHEKNYSGFKAHSIQFLNNYKNVTIDPKSIELKKIYEEIQKLSENIDITIKLDKLSNDLLKISKENVKEGALETFTLYLDFLNKHGMDSLYESGIEKFDTLALSFYNKNGRTIEIYRKLSSMKYIQDSFITREGKILEESLREEFLKLTSNLDINAIREFREKYRGVFTDEIENLKQRCRSLDRLNVMKEPSFISINEYYKKYPGKDEFLEIKVKKKLRRKIITNKSLEEFDEYRILFPEPDDLYETMEKYLFHIALTGNERECLLYARYFPEGKFIENIKIKLQYINDQSYSDSYYRDDYGL